MPRQAGPLLTTTSSCPRHVLGRPRPCLGDQGRSMDRLYHDALDAVLVRVLPSFCFLAVDRDQQHPMRTCRFLLPITSSPRSTAACSTLASVFHFINLRQTGPPPRRGLHHRLWCRHAPRRGRDVNVRACLASFSPRPRQCAHLPPYPQAPHRRRTAAPPLPLSTNARSPTTFLAVSYSMPWPTSTCKQQHLAGVLHSYW